MDKEMEFYKLVPRIEVNLFMSSIIINSFIFEDH